MHHNIKYEWHEKNIIPSILQEKEKDFVNLPMIFFIWLMIVIWDYSQHSSDLHICVICFRLLRFFNKSRLVWVKDHLNLRLTKLIKKTIRTDFRCFLYGVPIDTLVLGHMPNDLRKRKVIYISMKVDTVLAVDISNCKCTW